MADRRRAVAAAPVRLDTGIGFLKGVGPRRADAFARLGIRTAGDLLHHLPFRYLDASNVTPVVRAEVGQEVACVGTVVSKGVVPTRKGLRVFHAVIRDASGLIECVWPGQAFLDRTIQVGQTLLVAGPVRFFHGRQLAPKETIVVADAGAEAGSVAGGAVLPVYPATEGLSHKLIRVLIEQHLEALLPLVPETLPTALRERRGLLPIGAALRQVHRPASLDEAEAGRRRLAYDELLDLQLMLARARHLATLGRPPGTANVRTGEHLDPFAKALPWPLTGDQQRAVEEIFADMTSAARMHRLLMGDVGTGKTVVAAHAMLLAVENGAQAALLAPTELLAEQHAATLTRLLAPLELQPALLLGRLTAKEKQSVRARIASGAARLVVGTHALLTESTTFRKLGLVVVDEQHRFGVEQRAALVAKGPAPDVLLLSATPIPRSLALTTFGDLDLSILRERPPGRGTIRTAVRTAGQRARVLDFVESECTAGRQAYVVLPVIEESEKADLRAAVSMAESLRARWPSLEVGLVHGRLPTDERDAVMRAFRDGTVHVLVATTVIEVGIDVPNATIMLIEHPERFGLAQLHQLRGRVGRGAGDSYCILLAEGRPPARLLEFAKTSDGFAIAELDLRERGMGELIGVRQSGDVALRHARLPDDEALAADARRDARAILERDPTLRGKPVQPLRERAVRRYPRAEELFRTG
jgi:ATP-dependent DNA helicase RecG